MGKRSRKKSNVGGTSAGFHNPMNHREQAGRRKQNNSLKSIMKMQHLQNLATWAGGKACIPPLGALLGCQFSACHEALGIAPDPSLFSCQRCKMILQPGLNCTVRIVKNQAKVRRHCKKKPNTITKNNVIYSCHFCSYENVKRGTLKGYMKEICPPKPKHTSEPEPLRPKIQKSAAVSLEDNLISKDDIEKKEKASVSTGRAANLDVENPATPSASMGLTLLDSGRRKRSKYNSKKLDESMTEARQDGVNSKKRRRGWTSLKEIAQSNARERRRSFANFSIPFNL